MSEHPTEYTPTTEQVRRSWTDWNDLTSGHDGERFDRWLAAHDREVAARALRSAGDAMARERGVTFADALMVRWINDRATRIENGRGR